MDLANSRTARLIQIGLPAIATIGVVAVMLSGPSSHAVWYFVRASGVVSYGLLTATVIGGLLVSNRAMPPGQQRADVFDVHRFIGLLALASAVLHALALLLDEYVGFSPRQVLLPFTSDYRPVAVALGVMALYALAAVYASFYVKRWIGQRAWRAIHFASFAVFALAAYHGILSGADTGELWMLAVYMTSILSVLGLVMYRILRSSAGGEPRPGRALALAEPESPAVRHSGDEPDAAWRPSGYAAGGGN